MNPSCPHPRQPAPTFNRCKRTGSSLVLVCLLCVSGSEGQLTPAHDILFWDQVIETDQSRFFVLRRILFGFSVISIHAKPFDSDLFSGAEFEKCSPICQQRTVKHENRETFKAFVNAARGWSKATKEKKNRARASSPALRTLIL